MQNIDIATKYRNKCLLRRSVTRARMYTFFHPYTHILSTYVAFLRISSFDSSCINVKEFNKENRIYFVI